ncbi:DNA mismatch repair protein [Rhizophlyctis rosea]|uniref:DNA mismatch repair protein n=1 Tax=Rhizophlyctis rosea TaxID=64517 RepID=A0AAD5X5D4_9FUNG|nr:DNA mismatch repair protein [Rhizophlyctis rosea]
MIENSLDAGSTSIQILVKDGGLKLLQIQDNGHGIEKDDLPLVCERFATSKLKQYEDLESIATYGFRGEALASISYVAHVTLTTKTAASPCAWRASYSDGKMVPPKPGSSADPKPCAGNNGTQIMVEDLFYNVVTRRKALKSPADEYNRILDVVQRYAIHNSSVSFSCKKQGSNTADVHTLVSSTTLDNIRTVFGAAIAKELLSLAHTDDNLKFNLSGYISNANFNTKKMTFLLFINRRYDDLFPLAAELHIHSVFVSSDRSVDSSNLKRAIEGIYTTYLPKGTHPFVYMSLGLAPHNVDVNVHPTKQEVHFLNEDKVIGSVCAAIQNCLASANQSRTFYTQTFLPGAAPPSIPDMLKPKTPGQGKAPEHKLVRTDSRARTLDAFITPSQQASSQPYHQRVTDSANEQRKRLRPAGDEADGPEESNLPIAKRDKGKGRIIEANDEDVVMVDEEQTGDDMLIDTQPSRSNGMREYIEVRLGSVLDLRQEVRDASHSGLTSLFREHTFVGFVDDNLALVQYQTKLYMVNTIELSKELFYQLALKGFSNFGFIHLSHPAPIYDLVMTALEEEDLSEWGEGMPSKEVIAKQIVAQLIQRSEMLLEYFSMTITPDGEVQTLPIMLRGYLPNWSKLPLFLLKLGSEVEWDTEMDCFRTFSRELADFYAVEPPIIEDEKDQDTEAMHEEGGAGNLEDAEASKPEHKETTEYRHMIEHIIFPAFRAHLMTPTSVATNGTVLQLANLPDLYRVFERC